jgi:hypothetical protein
VDLLFARSSDGGQTFSSPKYAIDPDSFWGSHNGYGVTQPRVIAAGGTMHVVTTIFDFVFGGAEIFHVGSSDLGATFGDPVFVSDNDGVTSYSAAVDAEGDGTVSMAWGNDNGDTGEDWISYSRSIDDGATFSVPSIVSAPPSFAGCAQVLWSTNDVLTLWTAGAFGVEQILAARTLDYGATFNTPVDVDRNQEKSWCSAAVRDAAGGVYVVWAEGDNLSQRILFASSTDRGASFSAPVTVSAPAQVAECPSIEVSDGRMVVTWTLITNNDIGDSYLTTSTDGGTSFSTPLKIPSGPIAGGCYEVMADDATHVGLLWHSPPADGEQFDIYYGRMEISAQ